MQVKLVNGSVCDWILIGHKKSLRVIYGRNDSWEQNALTGAVLFLIFGCLALACNLWGLGFFSCLGEAFQSLDEETLEAMAKHETEEDKIFQMFKERVAAEPEQVRRWGSLRTYRFWHSILLHLQNVSLPFVPTVRNGDGDASSSSTHLDRYTLIFLRAELDSCWSKNLAPAHLSQIETGQDEKAQGCWSQHRGGRTCHPGKWF